MLNVWSIFFGISIAQGLFLVSIIAYRGSANIAASRLMNTLLALMIVTNLGYLVVWTELARFAAPLFVLPFGMMFLFGPLLYLYAQSIIDHEFHWKRAYWLHFIPYGFQLLLNIPLLTADRHQLLGLIAYFLSGNLPIRLMEKLLFAVQDVHLFIYLVITFAWMRTVRRAHGTARYIIPLNSRLQWLRALATGLGLFLVTVVVMYGIVLTQGTYNPTANYLYTLVCSGIMYFVAYKLVLTPGLIIPDFTRKYRAYMEFEGEDGERYVQKLVSLMNDERIFTNRDVKLATLAERMELPPHQVSKLINDKFGKTFRDLINEYRVNEFIARMSQPEYQSYSIYGVALDVGFNSKSSFNAAFKKATGKTPRQFRRVP